MRTRKASSIFTPSAVVISGGTLALAVATFVAALTIAPQRSEATPAYAQQTGKACGACHTNPAGGGPLTAAGKAFQKKKK